MLCGTTLASMATATEPSPLAVQGRTALDLAGHLAVLRDPGGRLTIEEVSRLPTRATPDPAGQPGFTPQHRSLALGYSTDAIWLRFTLQPHSGDGAPWWLVASPPFQDRLDLYVPDGQGGFDTVRAGDTVPATQRPLQLREPVFPLAPASTGTTYHLRWQSHSTLAMQLQVLAPATYIEREVLEIARHGLFLGLLLTAVLTTLICALWLRQDFFFVATAYLVLLGATQMALNGYDLFLLDTYLPQARSMLANQPIGWLSCLLPAAHGGFALSYLKPYPHMPRWTRALQAISVLYLLCAAATPWVDWVHLAPWVFGTLPVFVLLLLGLFVGMLRHRRQPALLMLAMFLPGLVAAVLQGARNLGWLPLGFWTSGLWETTTFLQVPFSMVVVLLRMREVQHQLLAAHEREHSRRRFAYVVAHELRTPLAVVRTALANLEERTLPVQPGMQPRFERMRAALARLNTLVDNALAEDRLGSDAIVLEREPVTPAQLLAQAQALSTADERHPLHLHAPPGGGRPCALDRQWLGLALANLIDNAIKYSPEGGPVEVIIEQTATETAIHVSDRGMGIAPDELPHVFGMGYRAPAARRATGIQGTGMGLYLVHQVAQLHGGTACAENRTGGGSRFSLRLPG